MIRATTTGVLKGYRTNLMQSFITLNSARTTVLKPRNFQSYADDPTAASKAYQMRRTLQRTGAQLDVSKSATYKFESAWAALGSVVDDVDNEHDNSVWHDVLVDANDPTGDARTSLGKIMIQLGDNILQSMNTKYGDNFVFAGADGLNVPFEIREDGNVYYRGVNVDTEVPKRIGEVKVGDGGVAAITVTQDANGKPVYTLGTTPPAEAQYIKTRTTSIVNAQKYTDDTTLMPVIGGGTEPLRVNSNGEIDTNEVSGAYYIRSNKTSTVTKDDYDADPERYFVLKDRAGNPVATTDKDGNPAYTVISGAMVYTDSYKEHNLLADSTGAPVTVDASGNPDPDGLYYLVMDEAELISETDYAAAQKDLEKLQYMSSEKNFIDIGLGLQEDLENHLIESSAFDEALQGINFLGYGVDEDGDPKNLISLARKIGELSSKYKDGAWGKDTGGYEELNRLAKKLEERAAELKTMHSDLDAEGRALKDNNDMLTSKADTLKEQIHDLEDMDEAEAISSFIWAQYCYNAALKVGNSILSESLMDYMS